MRAPVGRLNMTPGALHAAVFLFVFALVLAGANLAFTAREVSAVRATDVAASRAAASTLQLCEAANVSRAQQVKLWEHLVSVSSPPPHETRTQKRMRLSTVRTFLAYVHHVFAPRDCRALTMHHRGDPHG